VRLSALAKLALFVALIFHPVHPVRRVHGVGHLALIAHAQVQAASTSRAAPPATQIRPPTQPPSPPLPGGLTPYDVLAWEQVAICETGGNWTMVGPIYSGGLGFSNRTWIAYGGDHYAPAAGEASILDQMVVAERIVLTPPRSPEQGCAGYHGW
jgi:hypothetical protein